MCCYNIITVTESFKCTELRPLQLFGPPIHVVSTNHRIPSINLEILPKPVIAQNRLARVIAT